MQTDKFHAEKGRFNPIVFSLKEAEEVWTTGEERGNARGYYRG
jgi:hypothetical protein